MTAATSAGRFTLRVGDLEASFSPMQSTERRSLVTTARLQIRRTGQHLLQLVCDRPTEGVRLHLIEVAGEGARQGAVIRKRWRPAAAHTKFSS